MSGPAGNSIEIFIDRCRPHRVLLKAPRGKVTDFFVEVDLEGTLSGNDAEDLFAAARARLEGLLEDGGPRVTLENSAFASDGVARRVHLDFALRFWGNADRVASMPTIAAKQAIQVASEAAELCDPVSDSPAESSL